MKFLQIELYNLTQLDILLNNKIRYIQINILIIVPHQNACQQLGRQHLLEYTPQPKKKKYTLIM